MSTDQNRAAARTYLVGNGDRRPIARRLGAALSGRVGPATLDHLVDPSRIVALTGMGGLPARSEQGRAERVARVRELLAVAELATPGVTVLPQRPRRGLRLLAGGVAALAVAAGMALGQPIAPAQAAVIPTARPIVVTVSGPTARIDTDVVSTAATFADGGHQVLLRDGGLSLLGSGYGGSEGGAALVHVGGAVASRLLTPGTTMATLTDIGDGSVTRVPVQVLRRSKVTISTVAGVPGGVLICGSAAHYDLGGTYKGDQMSTVQVQVLRTGRWVTVDTVPTMGTAGLVYDVVHVETGWTQVRLVRLVGANVTGGTSRTVGAYALPAGGTGGGF